MKDEIWPRNMTFADVYKLNETELAELLEKQHYGAHTCLISIPGL